MKKLLNTLIFLVALLTAQNVFADDKQLAFPGADGYGKYTTGGRGGEVCYVTSLADCTDDNLVEGTLRWAIRHDNGGKPRTILFKVGGTILTTSDLKFQYPDVSILGQTAPGGGICIAGYKLYVCKNNVILRYLRFRAGDLAGWKSNKSCPSIDIENVKNVIIDHCSITWSMEECLTMYDNDSTTVQWCIIGEGLYNSMNAKGARAYATQWGGQWSTMHHCLLTNCNNRVPRFNGVRENASWNESVQKYSHDKFVDSEFANNVIFNWGKSNSAYGGEQDTTKNNDGVDGAHNAYDHIYMINNYWRPGPCTKSKAASSRYFVQGSTSNGYGQWYLDGNKFELGSKYAASKTPWTDAILEKVNADNLYGFTSGDSNRSFDLNGVSTAAARESAYTKYILQSLPEEGLSGLAYETADEAYAKVTTKAGASLPAYDEVDTRLLKEAAGEREPMYFGPDAAGSTTPSRGIGIIDTPNNIATSEYARYVKLTIAGVDTCNVYPDLSPVTEYSVVDTDSDGMPDAYETANSLNPNDASDGAAIADNGYSNLENFMNAVAAETVKADGTTSIRNVNAEAGEGSKATYSLSGMQVGADYKGVVVRNGKKQIQ